MFKYNLIHHSFHRLEVLVTVKQSVWISDYAIGQHIEKCLLDVGVYPYSGSGFI